MAAKKTTKAAISPERAAEIAADARSGRNWAEELNYGAACCCGAGDRTQLAAVALKSPHANPTGMCDRHPGGSVWASLPETWERVGERESSEKQE